MPQFHMNKDVDRLTCARCKGVIENGRYYEFDENGEPQHTTEDE